MSLVEPVEHVPGVPEQKLQPRHSSTSAPAPASAALWPRASQSPPATVAMASSGRQLSAALL